MFVIPIVTVYFKFVKFQNPFIVWLQFLDDHFRPAFRLFLVSWCYRWKIYEQQKFTRTKKKFSWGGENTLGSWPAGFCRTWAIDLFKLRSLFMANYGSICTSTESSWRLRLKRRSAAWSLGPRDRANSNSGTLWGFFFSNSRNTLPGTMTSHCGHIAGKCHPWHVT